MKFVFNIVLITLLIIPVSIFGNEYKITVLENTAGKIRFEITLNKPQIIEESGMKIARYNNTQQVIADGNLLLPQIIKFFNLPFEKTIEPRMLSVKWNSEIIKNYYSIKADNIETTNISSIVTTQYLGKRGSLPIHVLHIYPVKY